jgi:hypothetical protein
MAPDMGTVSRTVLNHPPVLRPPKSGVPFPPLALEAPEKQARGRCKDRSEDPNAFLGDLDPRASSLGRCACHTRDTEPIFNAWQNAPNFSRGLRGRVRLRRLTSRAWNLKRKPKLLVLASWSSKAEHF